ncbi:MAG: alpha-2-macroglobulin, partial [Treponema sp.]|nr:alpha-2-macroglobulin [Treponema sp.]
MKNSVLGAVVSQFGILKRLQFALTLIFVSLIAGNFASCNKKIETSAPDPQLVAAFSSGVINRSGPVVLEFTREFDTSKPVPGGAFRLEPSAKGTLSWRNSFTLEFLPSRPLKPGKTYTAIVDPSKLPSSEEAVPTGIFSFGFDTSIPFVEVFLEPVRVDETGRVTVSGYVLAEKGADPSSVEKTISAPELGNVSWTHDGGEHRFSFNELFREDEPKNYTLNWNGKPLDVDDKGFMPVLIPGNGVFEVVEITYRDNMLEVVFSSPLKSSQDLRGFVSLSGDTDIRYSLEGNIIRIYGEREASGIPNGAVLRIQDLADIDGNVLAKPVQYTVSSEKWELPEARFAGRGTILPTSQGSRMVIETRNLSGLLVEAFRMYGDNMIQFLQVNALDGKAQLERVGEPVWTKAFDFEWKDSYKNAWRRQGLDLSELARKYPDSMFHIRLTFRPRHVKYDGSGEKEFSAMQFPDDSFPPMGNAVESSYWDWYEDSDYYDWYDQRKNPYHPAFYRNYYDHDITVGRNVLVSDLGLLAKRGLDGSWIVAANNIKTAKGEPNVNIEILNYQGRSLYKLKTDGSGIAGFGAPAVSGGSGTSGTAGGTVPGNQTPAFIYASSGLGRAYLKIGESQALTVSHFDISGGRPASGIRALIYGERGVWRPGDDIFLTFLLSDPEKTLPANHPVSFELEDPRGRIGSEKTFTSSVDGFYPITVSTRADAPTGDWTARVKVGGNVFTRNLKIETVIPNRLRMGLDFGAKDYIENQNPVNLEAAWLYGASAPGLKADISVTFSEKPGGFPANGDYSFSDPSRSVSGERQTVWEGTLDNEGRAAFTMNLNPGNSVPGKLNARFMTRVFEPSGAFSSEQVTKEFSPYKRYVGLRLPKGDAARNMLLTDVDHRADILLLDADGKQVNGNVELDCAVYKLDWRWWWEKGENESAEFASLLSRNPIVSGKVTARNGQAVWNFQVKYPEWGRYMVLVRDAAGGHAAASTVYIDWPGWAGRSA